MEPNRIEQDFKQKLEQRTIQPTEMAWDRLDAMLSVAEKKEQPKKNYWMYVAASFLGFLLIGVLLLNQEKEAIKSSDVSTGAAVVTTEEPSANEVRGTVETETKGIDSLIMPLQDNAVAVQRNIKPAVQNKAQYTAQRKKEALQRVNSSYAVHNIGKAVAAQDAQVTPAQETEKLLAQSLDNHTPSAKKKTSIKVDAGSLLSSVEGELDESFRSEVLQKVVKNYNTVKSSVANRNYQ